MTKLFVKSPEGVKIIKHRVGDDIMWTVPATVECKCNRLLVAFARKGKMVWVKNGFSA